MTERLKRLIWFALGLIFLGLGLIGLALPVVPQVPFLVAAAWFFARSSPRFLRWMRAHPVIGPILREWEDQRAVRRSVKIYTLLALLAGLVGAWLLAEPAWMLPLYAVFAVVVALFVLTRPEPRAG